MRYVLDTTAFSAVMRRDKDIRILPWRDFLKMLWNGEVIS